MRIYCAVRENMILTVTAVRQEGELVSISPSRSGRLLVTYLEKGEKGVKWVMYQGEEASLRC